MDKEKLGKTFSALTTDEPKDTTRPSFDKIISSSSEPVKDNPAFPCRLSVPSAIPYADKGCRQ